MMDQPSDHPRSTEAWAIIDPDGRILMRYVGPHPNQLKAEFKRFNKRIDWKEGEHSVTPMPVPRKHKELLGFVDEAVRLLAKDFALTDLSDGVAFLRRIRQELREQQGGQPPLPLKGKVVEAWAVQEPTTGQAVIFSAVELEDGRLALAKQGELEKDVKH